MKISEVEKLTGVTQSVLRAWEKRYRWPKPARVNGSRIYRKSDIELIIRVNALSKSGVELGEILKYGFPDLPSINKKEIKKLIRPVFESKISNDIVNELEKAIDPIKCAECLIVLTNKKDRDMLLKYAKDLNDKLKI